MSIIVNDTGFNDDDWASEFRTANQLAANAPDTSIGVDLPSDFDPSVLEGKLENIDLIRIDFPSFADGRGFTIARRLRLMGFGGRLRARGHIIADQYAMARRAGFDEVEIDDTLAERQPEGDWLRRAKWTAHDYQSRLRA